MAKGINGVSLRKMYLDLGYTVSDKRYTCPDCRDLNIKRSSNKKPNVPLLTRAAKKILIFSKKGKPSVAACPCGFRRCEGAPESDDEHSKWWMDEIYSSTPPVPDITADKNARIGKCKATKANGMPCTFKAKPGGDYCGVHTQAAKRY